MQAGYGHLSGASCMQPDKKMHLMIPYLTLYPMFQAESGDEVMKVAVRFDGGLAGA